MRSNLPSWHNLAHALAACVALGACSGSKTDALLSSPKWRGVRDGSVPTDQQTRASGGTSAPSPTGAGKPSTPAPGNGGASAPFGSAGEYMQAPASGGRNSPPPVCVPGTRSAPNGTNDPCPQTSPNCPSSMGYVAVSTCQSDGTWDLMCLCLPRSAIDAGAPLPSPDAGNRDQTLCGTAAQQCTPGVPVTVTCAQLGLGPGAVFCDTRLCRFGTMCGPAPIIAGRGFSNTGGAAAPLGPSMTCVPGSRCQLSGPGICAADGMTCAFCANDAQCEAAYGAGWGCNTGTCQQH